MYESYAHNEYASELDEKGILHHRDCDVHQATLASEGVYGDPNIDPHDYACLPDCGYPVTTVDGFTIETWNMTESVYVQHVLEAVDRDVVRQRYLAEDEPRSDKWIATMAALDYRTGPAHWKFTLEDFGYEEA